LKKNSKKGSNDSIAEYCIIAEVQIKFEKKVRKRSKKSSKKFRKFIIKKYKLLEGGEKLTNSNTFTEHQNNIYGPDPTTTTTKSGRKSGQLTTTTAVENPLYDMMVDIAKEAASKGTKNHPEKKGEDDD
jgi:tRNA 2-selenouridine synthase SelU